MLYLKSNNVYTGFEPEKPDNYRELQEIFENQTQLDLETPSGPKERREYAKEAGKELEKYFTQTIHEEDFEIEDCLYVIDESDSILWSMQRESASSGILEMLRTLTESYSPTLDETTTILGDPDFAEKAWENFEQNHSEAERVHELISNYGSNKIQTWDEDLRTEYRDSNSPLQDFQEYSQQILDETFGEDMEYPLLRGMPLQKAAHFDTEIEYSSDSDTSYEEGAQLAREQIPETGLNLTRPVLDSWTVRPFQANWFAEDNDDQGVVLKNIIGTENIMTNGIICPTSEHQRVLPPFLDGGEFLLEDDKNSFSEDEVRIREPEDEKRHFEKEVLWMYNELDQRGHI